MKTVSIILPIYNMASDLKESAAALRSQTYKNLEIILVDDGSTDNSRQVCEDLAGSDPRIKVVHIENQGAGMARNTGVDNAGGDYVYFFDADDILEPDAIEAAVDTLEQEQSDMVIFGHRATDSRGREFYRQNYARCTIDAEDIRRHYTQEDERGIYSYQRAIWNKVLDLNKIKEHDIRFPSLRRHAEEVFNFRYLAVSEKVSFIDRCYYTYQKDDYQVILGKLPVNYIDGISQLRLWQREMLTGWNPDNQAALDFIRTEYCQHLFRALELTFYKKMDFDFKEKMAWLEAAARREEVQELCAARPPLKSRYQNMTLDLLQAKNISGLYFILWLKAQKNLHSGRSRRP